MLAGRNALQQRIIRIAGDRRHALVAPSLSQHQPSNIPIVAQQQRRTDHTEYDRHQQRLRDGLIDHLALDEDGEDGHTELTRHR